MLACAERAKRPGVTERAGILCKPYASHKPYNLGRVPVFVFMNLKLVLL